MLEERGFSTVAIASVRAQAEKTRPPRALWTTSQLGRPLGEPGDPPFQRRVLLAALRPAGTDGRAGDSGRLHRGSPRLAGHTGLAAPALPVAGALETPDAWAAAFGAELTALLPLWRAAQARFGRTTVGLSFQARRPGLTFATRFLAGELPRVPELDTAALALRMLCDDIKAFYGEAAQAEGPPPSAHQIDKWFWRQTVAGQLADRSAHRGDGEREQRAENCWRTVLRACLLAALTRFSYPQEAVQLAATSRQDVEKIRKIAHAGLEAKK